MCVCACVCVCVCVFERKATLNSIELYIPEYICVWGGGGGGTLNLFCVVVCVLVTLLISCVHGLLYSVALNGDQSELR